MQEQLFPQREQPYASPVKVVFNSKQFRLITIIGGGVCVLQWLIAILEIFSGYVSASTFTQPIFCTALVCLFLMRYRFGKHLEQKRQAAAQGDVRLLADEQPVPDAQALPLPITISMRPGKSVLIALSAIVVVVLLLAVLAVLLLFSSATTPLSQHLSWLYLVISVAAWVLLAALVVFAALYGNGQRQITLTE